MTKKRTPRRSQRQKGQDLYAARLRAVQPLVTFKMPSAKSEPSRYDKRKLKTYYDYLFGNKDRAGIAQGLRKRIAVRGKGQLEKVKKELGQDELSGVKYVFVTTALDPQTGRALPVKLRSRKNAPTVIEIAGVGFLFEAFDRAALIADPTAEVERAMEALMEHAPEDSELRFKIRAADKITFKSWLPSQIVNKVLQFMTRYTTVSRKGGPWDEWLEGLVLEYASDQMDIVGFDQARELRRDTERKIFNIDARYMLTLDAVIALGGRPTLKGISKYATGSTMDKETGDALKAMERQGFVEDIGKGRWRILPEGRTYYNWGKDILPFFNRK